MVIMGRKVPYYVFVLVASIIAFVVLLYTVFLPYLNKIEPRKKQHEAVLATIDNYKAQIRQSESLKQDESDIRAQLEIIKGRLLIDYKKSIDDLTGILGELEIPGDTVTQSSIKEIEGKKSSDGNALCSTELTLSFTASEADLKKIIQHIEKESTGYYIITNLDMRFITVDMIKPEQVGRVKAGDLQVQLVTQLYFFKDPAPTMPPETTNDGAAA